MDKLDRLGWSHGFVFTAYGARIGVRTNDAALLEKLRQRLPPRARETAGRGFVDILVSVRQAPPSTRAGLRHFHLMYASHVRILRTTDLEEILAGFESELHFMVATYARRWVFVHAGCVAWRGRAIVLPGTSRAGKSTLTRALLAAGAAYYSDEYAVFDARGRVHPYPRRLSLRDAGGARPRLVAAAELGATIGRRPAAVGLIALLRFKAGARARLRALSPAEALVELLANTVAVRRNPEISLRYLSRATRGCRAVKGTRGEAEAILPRLLDGLGTLDGA
jgi:hypothetical protein